MNLFKSAKPCASKLVIKRTEEATLLKLPRVAAQPMTRIYLGSHLVKSAVVETIELWLSNIVQTVSQKRVSLSVLLDSLIERELSEEDLENAECHIRNLLVFTEFAELNEQVLRIQYEALVSLACIYLLKGQNAQAKVITGFAKALFVKHSSISLSDDVKETLQKLVNARKIS